MSKSLLCIDLFSKIGSPFRYSRRAASDVIEEWLDNREDEADVMSFGAIK